MRNNQQGATLLEAVAALVILSTAIVAGLTAATVLAQTHSVSDQNDLALRYLKRELEFVRATDYDDLVDTPYAPISEDPRFEVEWEVWTIVTTRVVQVTLRRTETGTEHSLTTAICDRGAS